VPSSCLLSCPVTGRERSRTGWIATRW
jgi:hypothetical protein